MKRIVIDPGHGGSDPGSSGNGLVEKDLNLQIALNLQNFLSSGWECQLRLTRDRDIFVSLSDRVKFANSWPSDFFYSVHCNAFSDANANGWESYIRLSPTPAEKTQQRIIHETVWQYLRRFQVRDRGMKQAGYFVLRNTKNSAMLSEYLFVTGDRDNVLLKDAEILKGMAYVTAQGLAKALNLPEKKEVNEAMDNAIVINSYADFPAAEPLARKLNAPLFIRLALNDLNKAKTIFVCGGDLQQIKEAAPKAKIINLSGADRYQTSENIARLLQQL
ncbi:MAG: N-acetylmuramoyl-L-alanine amidase [Dethiobacteria bacterium]|jgi:N-acetylmuramoyl-L-alanine amidase